MKMARAVSVGLLTLGLILFIAVSVARAVQIGPDPTDALVNGNGPFAVSSATFSKSQVSGFGGGTAYYPSTTGLYGVIAVCPGYTGTSSTISWFAQRLATHGFVTIAMNTNSRYDYPSSRATQLRAALNWMINSSPSAIKSRIDSARRGLAGHSMGGGGTLIASSQDSTIKSGIPLTPWSSSPNTFPTVVVPQMIFGADGDTIAPISSHATRFYNSIPTSTKKAYAILNNASHMVPTSTDERIGRYGVVWAKRFVDEDTRYTPFLCGDPHVAYVTPARFDSFSSTCPF